MSDPTLARALEAILPEVFPGSLPRPTHGEDREWFAGRMKLIARHPLLRSWLAAHDRELRERLAAAVTRLPEDSTIPGMTSKRLVTDIIRGSIGSARPAARR
jgi:hypothetical protein